MSANRPSEPPFDGVPCPMCPSEVRNLHAVAHNLVNRLRPGAVDSLCAVGDKVRYLRDAVEHVELAVDSPEALRNLLEVGKKVAACKTYAEVFALEPELSSASAAVEVLANAHFANRMHSHGSI